MPENQTLADFERPALGVLWWGAPKSGKTVGAHTFPRTRTLDFDNGMASVIWAIREGIIDKEPEEIVYRTILPHRGERHLSETPSVLDRATDALDEWREEMDDWDTLVVDSLTDVSEACIARSQYYLGRQPKMNYDSPKKTQALGFRVMSREDWGPAMSQFQDFVDQVREFLTYGKHVVCVAHEYEETTDSGLVTAKYPLLIGQLRQRVPKAFDEVWYQTISKEGQYGIQTVQDRKVKAGSRLGSLPDFIPNPTFEKIMKIIENHGR